MTTIDNPPTTSPPAPAPAQQRALLLTDVVDSTLLSERLGDVFMAGVWLAHDRAARDLLPRWRGREIDKTDGMLLLFESAADAVHYALAYHQALTALPVPLKARAGLHVGAVMLRENAAPDVARGAKPLEVEGLAKPTAARVMSLALGGQTLLSEDARLALGEDAAWTLQSHGHWALKGLAEPLELFEVGTAESNFVLPPDGEKGYRVVRIDQRWLPVKHIANNLPQQITSFIGREHELHELKLLLAKFRLVTLLGMGGLGKTRLSLQVAAESMAQFHDGAWFLDLAPIRDPELVVHEAAQVLGVREEPHRPLLQTLCAFVAARRLLLIFDNCEHLLGAAAALAHALLRAASGLRVLASSREALRIPGEQAYPLAPLPVPEHGADLADPDELLRSTAVRLFIDRARLHKPDFTPAAHDAAAVVELVRRLEGIPLALELAAARMRSLSLADINLRLQDRYKLLTGGARVLLPRQQTLRALVDWSFDLLSADEQCTFGRLSAFVGGFDMAAAERVCGVEPLADDDVLDLLTSLVEKSLVSMQDREQGTRYRMLETIRDYAREKLQAAGEAQANAVRHCDYFFDFSKQFSQGLMSPRRPEWVRRAETELDNLRAAIALALAGQTDPILAVKFATQLSDFWLLRGYASEGRGIVRTALALPAVQASDMARSYATYVGAALASSQGDHAEARQLLEQCLELRRGLGNPVQIAATLSTLSLVLLQAGDAARAAASEREALQLFREQQDRLGEALGLLHLGQIAVYEGDAALARSTLAECRRIAQALGNREIEGEAELRLGECAFDSAEAALAQEHLQRSLDICREAGDRNGEAHALGWLGKLELAGAELESARRHLGEALRMYRDFELREEVAECLEDHAELLHREGDAVLGVRLAAAAQTYRERLDLARSVPGRLRWSTRLQALREAVGDAAFDAAWRSGGDGELAQAVHDALAGAPAGKAD